VVPVSRKKEVTASWRTKRMWDGIMVGGLAEARTRY
jgi:hypothetical protein